MSQMPDRLRADNFAKIKLRKNLKKCVVATFIPVPGKSADKTMHADGWDTYDQ